MRHIEYACSLRRDDLTHALEFGVYTGQSISLIRAILPDTVDVFGFDSFVGLPDDWIDEHGNLVGVCSRGFFSTNGVIPDVAGVTFIPGWFEDTIPKYIRISRPIALLHIDCDLHASARTVLHGVDHLLVAGSIVVFDEWVYNNDPRCNDHEQRAFYEWVNECGREFELVPFIGESNEQQIVRITR